MKTVRRSPARDSGSVLPCSGFRAGAFQPDNQDSNVRWRYSRNASCLTERGWAYLQELLTRLSSQTRHGQVVECIRDLLVLQTLEFGNLVFLAGNITRILDDNLNLLYYII